MIEIESLTKLRAGRPVLESVSFRGAEAGVTVRGASVTLSSTERCGKRLNC